MPQPADAPRSARSPSETDREPWRDQYERDVLQAADANHIWLNAFACIHPTDELALRLGRQVLAMLDGPENTHVSTTGHMLDLPSQRELVLRINKS